jgi:hypothetical protein
MEKKEEWPPEGRKIQTKTQNTVGKGSVEGDGADESKQSENSIAVNNNNNNNNNNI